MTIALQLTGQSKDLGGGFIVRRLLPAAQRQAVGPFLFFDHFGPVTVAPGQSHDVRPHPHIGLATVTYLFSGAIMHRDSLGFAQRIEPGAINWMTAGRGIVHSERGPEELKGSTYVNHGIQLWAALPKAFEEVDPDFVHTPSASIPEVTVGDAQARVLVRVLIGQAFGKTSPVKTFSPTVYLDVKLASNGVFELPPLAEELAVYAIDSAVDIDGVLLPEHTMALLAPSATARISASNAARLIVFGGAALDGHRLMWWNFVSSRKERIVQAAHDWTAQTMGVVNGDADVIALPDKPI